MQTESKISVEKQMEKQNQTQYRRSKRIQNAVQKMTTVRC